MNQRTHVIPLGTPEPLHHASLGCWCHPLSKDGGEIAIHNAKDGREKWERQGIIDSDKRWCLVYENLGCENELVAALEDAELELEANKVAMIGPEWAAQRTCTGGALLKVSRAITIAREFLKP